MSAPPTTNDVVTVDPSPRCPLNVSVSPMFTPSETPPARRSVSLVSADAGLFAASWNASPDATTCCTVPCAPAAKPSAVMVSALFTSFVAVTFRPTLSRKDCTPPTISDWISACSPAARIFETMMLSESTERSTAMVLSPTLMLLGGGMVTPSAAATASPDDGTARERVSLKPRSRSTPSGPSVSPVPALPTPSAESTRRF